MKWLIDETVGLNIRKLRLRNNISQQALANATGISRQTISTIEKGGGANTKTFTRIAEYFNVSPLYLYREIENKEDIEFRRVVKSVDLNMSNYEEKCNYHYNKLISELKKDVYYEIIIPIFNYCFEKNIDKLVMWFYDKNEKELKNLFEGLNKKMLEIIRKNLIKETEE